MLLRFLPVFLLLAWSALFCSCAKVGPAGANGSAYTNGVIAGHVRLYDQYGYEVMGYRNRAKLSLSGGTALSPDTNGYFSYAGLATGYYNIIATDSLYATTYINNFQFLLDTLYLEIRMSQIPTFSPTAIYAARDSANHIDSITVAFDTDYRQRNCILFVWNADTVSSAISEYTVALVQPITAAGNSLATFSVTAQSLYDLGYSSGSKVYFAAYGYVVNDCSAYTDHATGKIVYNAVSATHLVDSAIVP